ncbi:MAG: NAD(P)/FAD-dependent oxidoreductase [Bacteroidetes bacterium]|nr:NAD(P)/FAD-dependent oxidoreductase [Bacteroidota bacterium]
MSLKKKAIVVGGGFAGVNLVKELSRDKQLDITLVDINNYHFFPPLLYQVATAFIEPSNISYPFRRMFQKKKNIHFHLGKLLRIFPGENYIVTDTGNLGYDILVIAIGTQTNYFGMKDVEKNAMPMKNITDAINLRNHLLLSLEKATRAATLDEKQRDLNIVIAGGGPTGVEIAGMLAEMRRNIVSKEYLEINAGDMRIHLIDASPTLLGPMSKKSQEEAKKVLSDWNVEIKLDTAVKSYQNGMVTLSDGSEIPTNTLIWASGVTGAIIPGLPEGSIGRGNRILVDEFNRVQTLNIFAIGDICLQLTDNKFPKGHPQLAQVAIQQGNLLGKNIPRLLAGKAMQPFVYHDKGSLAIISKYKAVADLPKIFFKGFFAWLIWLFIHILPLAGFRNKVKLAFSWFWSFMTNDPTLRLIIRPVDKDD